MRRGGLGFGEKTADLSTPLRSGRPVVLAQWNGQGVATGRLDSRRNEGSGLKSVVKEFTLNRCAMRTDDDS
jgi:hypothetical protein